MALSYSKQTINSSNPLARFSHRSRLKTSVKLALEKLGNGKLLDYGCGSGAFISALNETIPNIACGYEPFMSERFSDDLNIFKEISDLKSLGPFQVITILETIEHLSVFEVDSFLRECEPLLLREKGGFLISAPIEFGPVLLLKEFNRSWFRRKPSEYGFFEFLKSVILCVPGKRAIDIKLSHKGFDFRRSVEYFKKNGWVVSVVDYGPVPIYTWYGNSQVYMWVCRA